MSDEIDPTDHTDEERVAPPRLTRRQLVRLGGWTAAGFTVLGAGAAGWRSHTGSDGDSPDADRGARTSAGAPSRRRLVIVEMGGGNDGLSTLVPHDSGIYHRARPSLALEDDLVEFADGWALAPGLAPLATRGLAVVAGVGVDEPDLSHFEMMARWWGGSVASAGPTDGASGFLGRLCDALFDEQQLSGVSVGGSPTPALSANNARTTALTDTSALRQIHSFWDSRDDAIRRGIESMLERPALDESASPRDRVIAAVASGLDDALGIDNLLAETEDSEREYPDTGFGNQLSFAAQLLRLDPGIQVIHVPMDGSDFDTHTDHRTTHANNMATLGDGLAAFLDDLADSGLGNDVLVATTSEFGRRLEENDGGLDHGTASVALCCGAVTPGMVGDPSPLNRLDGDGNLVATVGFDRYYATLASWLDVDPSEVLDDEAKPLDGLLAG